MLDSESGSREGSSGPGGFNLGAPNEGTVPLSGFLVGPEVHETADIENRDIFRLHRASAPEEFVEVSWWNIRWIDSYPHPAYDEPGWDESGQLGSRIIWVNQDLRLDPGGFLAGEIAQDYLPEADLSPFIQEWNMEIERRRVDDGELRMCSRPSCTCVTMPDFNLLQVPPEMIPAPDV